MPYLKGRGITTIDKLILTHADADHIEGADEVLEEIRCTKFISHRVVTRKDDEGSDAALPRNRRYLFSDEGRYFLEEWADCFPLCGTGSDGEYIGNDSSLVLYMTTTGPSFLFTGDMEKEGESDSFANMDKLILHLLSSRRGIMVVERLVRKHSYDTLRPELTIFSAGKNNRYGHPHPEVVETFRNCGLPTLSTAESGSITVTVKGRSLWGFCHGAMKKRSLFSMREMQDRFLDNISVRRDR